jgi:hypothetical protein
MNAPAAGRDLPAVSAFSWDRRAGVVAPPAHGTGDPGTRLRLGF